jgi:CheY-like chemotaxis protein
MKKKSIRIAIADDDPDIMRLLQIVVRDLMHYDMDVYLDGREVLEGVRVRPPDLLILDVMMPVIDGLQVLSELRKDLPDLPVIMLTAHAKFDDAKAAGANVFMQKPFLLHELREHIDLLLQ